MLLGHGCESLKTDVQGVRVPLTSAVGLRSAGLPPGTHKDVSSVGSLDGQENSSFMAERGWSQITELFQDLQLDTGWRACLRHRQTYLPEDPWTVKISILRGVGARTHAPSASTQDWGWLAGYLGHG